jgi:hypothetical protein
MLPLTLDDLLPLEEYAARRREFFESHSRYVDRYRRVRIGPRLTLIFENRQTLWFRVQEIIRIARLADPLRLKEELSIYNRLLPGLNMLQAALIIEISDEAQLVRELSAWRNLQGSQLCLRLGERGYPSTLVTSRPEDRCIGAAHWVQFTMDGMGRQLLGDPRQPAFFAFGSDHYRHQSPPVSDDVRQSLVDDLNLSDRNAA